MQSEVQALLLSFREEDEAARTHPRGGGTIDRGPRFCGGPRAALLRRRAAAAKGSILVGRGGEEGRDAPRSIYEWDADHRAGGEETARFGVRVCGRES